MIEAESLLGQYVWIGAAAGGVGGGILGAIVDFAIMGGAGLSGATLTAIRIALLGSGGAAAFALLGLSVYGLKKLYDKKDP